VAAWAEGTLMNRIELDEIPQPKEDASVAHELASPRRGASSPGRSASSPVTEQPVAEGTQVLPTEKPACEHAKDDTPTEELPPLPADGGASLLKYLPSLPRPAYWTLLQERLTGVAVIGSICGVCGGTAHGFCNFAEKWGDTPLPREVPVAVLSVTYSLVALAVSFQLVVLFGAKGRIARSKTSCLPLPREAVDYLQKLAAGEKVEGQMAWHNLTRSDDAHTFCVRCFVWRPEKRQVRKCCPLPCGLTLPYCEVDDELEASSHHCSTCGRCAVGFDHHCGVLGACITEANTFFFRGLLVLGVLGPAFTFLLVPAVLGTAVLCSSADPDRRWIAILVLALEIAITMGGLAWLRWGDPAGCLWSCIFSSFGCSCCDWCCFR